MLQRLQETEQRSGLANPRELDTKCLDLDEQVLDVDDLVPDQGLQEHADQPNKSVLHVLVLDVLARRDAVRNVEVDELRGEVDSCGQPIHHLHRMQAHLHVHQDLEVSCDLRTAHQLQQHLDGYRGVVLDKVWQLPRGEPAVVDQFGIVLQPAEYYLLLRSGQGGLHRLGDQLPHLGTQRCVSAHCVIPHGLAQDVGNVQPMDLVHARLEHGRGRPAPSWLERQQRELVGSQLQGVGVTAAILGILGARRLHPSSLVRGIPDNGSDAHGSAGGDLRRSLLVHSPKRVQVRDGRDVRGVMVREEISHTLFR
mmetsp:Transcript_117469/g.230500  ORF Transcript_117469/g.230500 Transcript_117469/m.230500 type:complete len:310 (+) Transcript_117469:125-1054(+)